MPRKHKTPLTLPLAVLRLDDASERRLVLARHRVVLEELGEGGGEAGEGVARPAVGCARHDACQNVLAPVARQGLATCARAAAGGSPCDDVTLIIMSRAGLTDVGALISNIVWGPQWRGSPGPNTVI